MEVGNRLSQGRSGNGRQKRTSCQFQRVGEKSLGRGFHPSVVAWVPSAYLYLTGSQSATLGSYSLPPALHTQHLPTGDGNLLPRWCCEQLSGLSAVIPRALKKDLFFGSNIYSFKAIARDAEKWSFFVETPCATRRSEVTHHSFTPSILHKTACKGWVRCLNRTPENAQGRPSTTEFTHLTFQGWLLMLALLCHTSGGTATLRSPDWRSSWLSICHHGAGRQANFWCSKGVNYRLVFIISKNDLRRLGLSYPNCHRQDKKWGKKGKE